MPHINTSHTLLRMAKRENRKHNSLLITRYSWKYLAETRDEHITLRTHLPTSRALI